MSLQGDAAVSISISKSGEVSGRVTSAGAGECLLSGSSYELTDDGEYLSLGVLYVGTSVYHYTLFVLPGSRGRSAVFNLYGEDNWTWLGYAELR